ncbi:hypothetical protein OIDMADRAFT_96629, partial [Oidiodendron maius Zn]
GMIPVQSDIQEIDKTEEWKMGKEGNKRAIPHHILLRRRAQNRASQRAFRKRKEKRMKDIEEQLTDLQERHSELIQMYKTLQLECSATRQEMETLRQ